ncbi:MAG: DUF4258 domain-containing protein [Chthoniobacteraceae bacterium]
MAKLIPAAERILRARDLIQKARDYPVPTEEGGRHNFSYIAKVKDLLQQARDLVKFIPQSPTATADMKEDVRRDLPLKPRAGQQRYFAPPTGAMMEIVYRIHAIQRMFERNVSPEDMRFVLQRGKTIEEYEDAHYPGSIAFGRARQKTVACGRCG